MSQAVAKAERKDAHQIVEHPSETSAVIAMIERAARDPSVDLDKMDRLITMKTKMEAREAERQFDMAMSLAQAEMRPVAADASNPQTRSKYASYYALDQKLRPTYTKHGFSLSFNTGEGAPDQFVRVLCRVGHRDGCAREYHIDMPADGKGAKGGDVMTKTHATGSALTYGQRYLLKMIFNIAVGGDDDGNAASSDPITEAQAEEIQKLVTDTKSDITKFLKYIGAPSIADIPASKFASAKAALESKKQPA